MSMSMSMSAAPSNDHDSVCGPAPSAAAGKEDRPASEWTVVTRKTGGRRRGRGCGRGRGPGPGQGQERRRSGDRRIPATLPPPSPDSIDYSSDDILKERGRIRSRFRESPCYAQLKERLTAIFDSAPDAVTGITHAFCLGTGSFVPNLIRYETMRTTHMQLDAFLLMVEVLAIHTGKPITCIFQEPGYLDADVAFLEGLGHKVVESPEAFRMVDGHSLVYGIHLYRDIYARLVERVYPAIYVGTDWEAWDLGMKDDWKTSPDRLREMDKTFGKVAFPHDDDGLHAFNDTSIYWRKKINREEKSS